MTALIIVTSLLVGAFVCLFAAIGHLGGKVARLERALAYDYKTFRAQVERAEDTVTEIGRQVYDPNPKHNQGTSTPDPIWKRLADVERLAAGNESACELNAASLEAQTTLSIMHAQTITQVQSRVDKLAHDPHYQKPVRKDN